MHQPKTKLLNAALAGLLSAGSLAGLAAISGDAHAADECYGINACKGKGDCGGKGYSCAGNNECKRKGWLTIPSAVCERIIGASTKPAGNAPAKEEKKESGKKKSLKS